MTCGLAMMSADMTTRLRRTVVQKLCEEGCHEARSVRNNRRRPSSFYMCSPGTQRALTASKGGSTGKPFPFLTVTEELTITENESNCASETRNQIYQRDSLHNRKQRKYQLCQLRNRSAGDIPKRHASLACRIAEEKQTL